MRKERLFDQFQEVFGGVPEGDVYRAPGRVNLIGEHTDYNGGLVLPIAIDMDTCVCMRETANDIGCVYSTSFDQLATMDLNDLDHPSNTWTDYVQGIMVEIRERGKQFRGFDLLIDSEVPVGSGLSSSAALEIAVANAFNDMFDLGLVDLQLIRLCQSAENNFVGAHTGIMDQYISYHGLAGKALLLNTKELVHEVIELELDDFQLVVIDTTVSHEHENNQYNVRRSECEQALEVINGNDFLPEQLTALSQISTEQLSSLRSVLEGRLFDRVSHVVNENQRVIGVADFLTQGKIEKVGELFYESHRSLKNLYEVSSKELDFLVDFARDYPVPGARMTGGGFGGAIINLVPEGKVEDYIQQATFAFENEFNITPKCFVVNSSDGARVKPMA